MIVVQNLYINSTNPTQDLRARLYQVHNVRLLPGSISQIIPGTGQGCIYPVFKNMIFERSMIPAVRWFITK